MWTRPCGSWTCPRDAMEDRAKAFVCLDGMPLDALSFPHELCGYDSISEFYEHHRMDIVLQFMLPPTNTKGYHKYLQAVNQVPSTGQYIGDSEMEDLYPYVLSQFQLRGFATDDLHAMIQSDFPGAKLPNPDKQEFKLKLAEHLICSVCPEYDKNNERLFLNGPAGEVEIGLCNAGVYYDRRPSDFGGKDVGQCLAALQLSSTDGVTASILTIVHEELCSGTNRLAFRVKYLCILMFCLEELQEMDPFICRYAIHICLQHIAAPNMEPLCTAIIRKVCVLDDVSGAISATKHLRDIVAGMVSCITTRLAEFNATAVKVTVPADSAPGSRIEIRGVPNREHEVRAVTVPHGALQGSEFYVSADGVSCTAPPLDHLKCFAFLRDLLHERLFSECSAEAVRKALGEIKRFPEEVVFHSLNSKLEQIHTVVTQVSLGGLQRFVKESGGDLLPQLEHLKVFLRQSQTRSSLYVLATDSNGTILSQCIWKLINLCSYAAGAPALNRQVQQLASTCLGEIGPLGSDSIAFSPYDEKNSCAEDETIRLERNKKILYVLDGYQIQNDARVVCTARRTIRQILRKPKGRQRGQCECARCGRCAFQGLETTHFDAFSYIRVHEGHSQHDQGTTPAVHDERVGSITDRHLWTTDGKSYASWICRLCATCIAHGSTDDVLMSCFELATFKEDFAELLLPYAIYSVVTNGQAAMHDELSGLIQDYLTAQAAAKTPKRRAILVLLRSLDYLRQKRIQKRDYQPLSYQKIYYLSVDYLQVARAALRCDAYFTALFYVEQQMYENRSKQRQSKAAASGRRSSAAARSARGVAAAAYASRAPAGGGMAHEQKLQMQIYSCINEPDCIYGVNKSLASRDRMRAFDHEQAWEKSLGLHDTILQRAAADDEGSGAHDALHDALTAPECRKGVLSSLARLGFTHVLDTYCRGALSMSESLTPAESIPLQEYQYEAAWRTCRWDDQIDGQLLERDMPLGFHASVFKCIQALRVKDVETFQHTIEKGRLSLIHDLSATSLESTKRVYHTLSKLQMLAIVEEAWNTDAEERRLAWHQLTRGIKDKFEFVEPVLSLQVAVLSALGSHADDISQTLVTLASCARKACRFQIGSA
eukprot:SAG11_NODE_1680_length_4459_cov_1.671101_3_plen_1106_part_01